MHHVSRFIGLLLLSLMVWPGEVARGQDVELETNFSDRAKLAEAERTFETLHGKRLRAAQASDSAADDLELARDLLEQSHQVGGSPYLQNLLRQRALELCIGFEAGEAMAREAVEKMSGDNLQARVRLYEHHYRRVAPSRRRAVAALYLEAIDAAADECMEAESYEEAVRLYRAAQSVQGVDRRVLAQRMSAASEMLAIDNKIASFQSRLKAGSIDHNAAKELALLLLGEHDDLQGARAAAEHAADPTLVLRLEQMTQPLGDLKSNELFDVGEFLFPLVEKTSQPRRAKIAERTEQYFRRFLALHSEPDGQRLIAQSRARRLSAEAHLADANAFAGHRYKFFEENVTWATAKARCEEMGGYLVCIESEREQAFLQTLVGDKSYWAGATDEATEGVWRWVNGSPMTFTNWDPGEPNNADGNEHYLMAYKWNDLPGHLETGFICEWDF